MKYEINPKMCVACNEEHKKNLERKRKLIKAGLQTEKCPFKRLKTALKCGNVPFGIYVEHIYRLFFCCGGSKPKWHTQYGRGSRKQHICLACKKVR